MSSKVGNATKKILTLRRFCAATVVAVFPLLSAASAQGEELNEQVTQRIE